MPIHPPICDGTLCTNLLRSVHHKDRKKYSLIELLQMRFSFSFIFLIPRTRAKYNLIWKSFQQNNEKKVTCFSPNYYKRLSAALVRWKLTSIFINDKAFRCLFVTIPNNSSINVEICKSKGSFCKKRKQRDTNNSQRSNQLNNFPGLLLAIGKGEWSQYGRQKIDSMSLFLFHE